MDELDDVLEDFGTQETSSIVKRKNGTTDQPSAKKPKKDKGKYKQPTPEELNNFREVENLFNSVLLKAEVDDLLSSSTYDETKRIKKSSAFEKWFNKFTTDLKNIAEYESVKTSEFIIRKKQKLSSVQIMINNTCELTKDFTISDGNTISCFVRPESVCAFSGFKSGACLKPNFTPNIAIKMPKSAFYEKDYINNRYLVKRFHYLLYLMHELKNNISIHKIELNNYLSNDLLRILIITPDYNHKIGIKVFVVPELDSFKLSRMEPNKNNFKINVYQDIELDEINFTVKLFKDVNFADYTAKGTPLYNTLLLHDLTLEHNNVYTEKTLSVFTCCQEAIKLIIIWLKQRQLTGSYSSFTHELLTYTIIYLIQKNKINKHMSCYQVSRIFFIFISESDWRVKPITLSSSTDFGAFTNNFDIVFTDYSGFYNLAAFLNESNYDKLKIEAARALEILTKDTCRAFMALFKTKMAAPLQYDCIIYFNDKKHFKSLYSKYTSDDLKWKYFGFYDELITKQLIDLLKYGLGSRVECIVPLQLNLEQSDNSCSINNNNNKKRGKQYVFGLILNPAQALNPLVIGPQQYDVEAAKFKEFWQDLVSLRRFPNTSIHEAVFFDKVKTVADKRKICSEIVQFIAKKINVQKHVVISTEFEEVLQVPNIHLPFENGTNEEITKLTHSVTDELFSIVRNLVLPEVAIEMIQCISDVHCGTDPFPAVPTNYTSGKKVTTSQNGSLLLREHKHVSGVPRYTQTIDCVMHINLLNKTAFDDLGMYLSTLSATYDTISRILPTAPNLPGRVLAKANDSYVDVLYKGLVFRMRAFNDRHVALLKRIIDENGQVAYRSNEDSLAVEREGCIKPKLYGALNGLYRQHPCFGVASALAKRWLRSQLLHSTHINDVTVNLLMATVFLSPEPFGIPTLPQVAFIRFLRLLAEFPFDYLPIVVNFNNELNKDEVSKFESEFLEKRSFYNTVHIVTLHDEFKSIFTKKSPDCRILRRLKQISVDALNLIDSSVLGQEVLCSENLFKPNIKGYDVIIHLHSMLNSKRHLKVFEKIDKPIVINEYNDKKDTKFPIVAFNLVDEYLKDLEDAYGKYAYFFHDSYGGSFIGVLWNREVCVENNEFKISNLQGRTLVDNKLMFNFKATVSEFAMISRDLVQEIVENDNVK